ncbi:hypothetical protein E2C01_091684 [Portunus trituberculatus]|uniref:Uncharacterized protein n=1 Tax=Portunus trituberculatus TaxID=210409 RepID=A0A5B7JQ14_PORTR|nr:hypothetical protein [Portunus trituberculatus]
MGRCFQSLRCILSAGVRDQHRVCYSERLHSLLSHVPQGATAHRWKCQPKGEQHQQQGNVCGAGH